MSQSRTCQQCHFIFAGFDSFFYRYPFSEARECFLVFSENPSPTTGSGGFFFKNVLAIYAINMLSYRYQIDSKGVLYGRKNPKSQTRHTILILSILLYLAAVALIIAGGVLLNRGVNVSGAVLLVIGILWVVFGFIPFWGSRSSSPRKPWC